MTLVSSVAIYFVIWWLVLFLVLPFGVEHYEPHEIPPGTDPGAPKDPHLVRSAIWTTVLACIVFAGVYTVFGVLHLTLDDIFMR